MVAACGRPKHSKELFVVCEDSWQGFLPSGQPCLLLLSAALLKCHGGGWLGKGSRDMSRGTPPVLSLSENYLQPAKHRGY